MATKPKRAPVPSGRLDREVKARIDADLYRRLQSAATLEDRSESAIMRRALREHLDRQGVA